MFNNRIDFGFPLAVIELVARVGSIARGHAGKRSPSAPSLPEQGSGAPPAERRRRAARSR